MSQAIFEKFPIGKKNMARKIRVKKVTLFFLVTKRNHRIEKSVLLRVEKILALHTSCVRQIFEPLLSNFQRNIKLLTPMFDIHVVFSVRNFLLYKHFYNLYIMAINVFIQFLLANRSIFLHEI